MDLRGVVRAATDGDREAWNTLVARYSGLIWGVARAHRLGDADAADVFQTTWLRLVEHLDSLRNPEGVGAWLATTARHECLRVLRVGQRHVLTDGFDLPDEGTDIGLDARLLTGERRCGAVAGVLGDLGALPAAAAGARRRSGAELRGGGRRARHADREHRPDAGALPGTAARGVWQRRA